MSQIDQLRETAQMAIQRAAAEDAWSPTVLMSASTILRLIAVAEAAHYYAHVTDGHVPGEPVGRVVAESGRRYEALLAALDSLEGSEE